MPLTLSRFAARATIFLLILLCLLVGIDKMLERNMPTHNQLQYAELLHSKIHADVIILGSSTAVHGYDPAILSRIRSEGCDFSTVYNFGMMGAQPPFYATWYKEFIGTYYKNPSLVIVSLDWFSAGPREERQEKLGEYRLAQDSHYLPWDVWSHLFRSSGAQGRGILALNFFRLMKAGMDIVHVAVPKHDALLARFYRGYMPLDHTLESPITAQRTFHVDDMFLKSLRTLIHEIQAQHADVLLVQMPTLFPDTIDGLIGATLFEKIADEEHVSYLDYNGQRRSSFNDTIGYFSDWSHLNGSGSEIFSKRVSSDIAGLLNQASAPFCRVLAR